MLVALVSGFALSQAYRTVAGLLSVPLQADFALSANALGVIFGAFHFAFGGMQLLMGLCIDLFGIRRTILTAFPLTVVGAILSGLAQSPTGLTVGQALIGIGCSPAFIVCTVFIARHFPQERFAAMSGFAMGLGGLGLIFTGTPLAWLVEVLNWRWGFFSLALLSALAWLLIFWRVFEPTPATTAGDSAPPASKPSVGQALLGYVDLLRMRQTAGILALVFVVYASFITLRGLWLGPFLVERFGQSLVFSGNVALVLSVISMFSPSLFGRFDPGNARRRRWLPVIPGCMVLCFLGLAFSQHLGVSIALIMAVAIFMGSTIWQYANVRHAYPVEMAGRAMALFTMFMFLGVAFMQFLTGQTGALLPTGDRYTTVFCVMAVMVGIGTLAYMLLPQTTAPTAPTPAAQ